MEIKRDLYLNKLIRHKHNGLVKVITGLRRCGKSYLLFNLFYKYLLGSGVPDDHIIKIALDDRVNKKYRDPDVLCEYVNSMIKDKGMYYILLDEVQFVNEFEDVLNSFLHIPNADTYVTGSNAKFLSKDIITEFRGRGVQIHIAPLSFGEFMSAFNGTQEQGWKQYCNFGGLPKLFDFESDEDKFGYLKNIFASLTNPKKLSDTFKSMKQVSVHPDTLKKYLDYFADAFLIEQVKRYDIKGKRYINTPAKYYFTDIGLRNARLNFRQEEETHILENIVYNELMIRGFNVDAGTVDYYAPNEAGKSVLKQSEVDFVCNLVDKRYYIQVALSIPTREKLAQEQNSLLHINDSFKKIIIVKDLSRTHYSEDGILLLDLFEFLLQPDRLNI